MKILQVVQGLGKASGVTTFVENVVQELRSLGHTVDVCTRADSSILDSYQLDRYDVVHIHGLWSPLLHRASRRARRRGIPIVWSTHGMTAPWSLKHKWWKKCLPWFLYQKRDLRQAAFLHATVAQEAKWNRELGFTRSFIAPLGTQLPDVGRTETKRSDLQSREYVLLFVGRIYPVKALDRLLEAFASVDRSVRETWRVRIVGPDQAGHRAELTALCTRLGLSYSVLSGESADANSPHPTSPQVAFVGPKFEDALVDEYRNCDCLALVSHTENFGATVVDALAHGKPVLTGTQTPWDEVVNRKCGWWVGNDPPTLAKALSEMMSLTDSVRAEMGVRGRQLVEDKYTWKAVAQKLLGVYEEVCGTSLDSQD